MPPKVQKSKAAKALAAASSSKSKGKKKRWAKLKVKDKKNYRVVFNQELYDRVVKDVPKKMKIITIYNMIEAYKINGSLARKIIDVLANDGKIREVARHGAFRIYTKVGEAAKKVEVSVN
mmetsp:Transcript_20636/g.48666  ORF Transcript_20636/g.48666 Transcript_20636/m.48666 type:complete len:120 (+) Transcript_20636:18-377(+)